MMPVWLQVVLAVSNISATVMAGVIPWWLNKRSTSKPTPIPEANQPKYLIQRMRQWLADRVRSPFIIPPANIVYNVWNIVHLFRLNQGVTKLFVVEISTSFGMIVFSAVSIAILAISNMEDKRFVQLRTVVLAHHDTIADLVKLSRSSFEIQKEASSVIDGVQNVIDGIQRGQASNLDIVQKLVNHQLETTPEKPSPPKRRKKSSDSN